MVLFGIVVCDLGVVAPIARGSHGARHWWHRAIGGTGYVPIPCTLEVLECGTLKFRFGLYCSRLRER